jgi:hypothetical protein
MDGQDHGGGGKGPNKRSKVRRPLASPPDLSGRFPTSFVAHDRSQGPRHKQTVGSQQLGGVQGPGAGSRSIPACARPSPAGVAHRSVAAAPGGGAVAAGNHEGEGCGGAAGVGAGLGEGPAALTRAQVEVSQRVLALRMEVALLLVNLSNLLIQSFNLYKWSLRRYDGDLLVVAALSLAQHVLWRHMGEALTARKKLKKYFGLNMGVMGGAGAGAALLLVCLSRLGLASPRACALCLHPYLLALVLFRRLPAPLPLELVLAQATSHTKGVPRRRVAAYCAQHAAFRVLESVFLAGVLPLVTVRDRYLYYNLGRCLCHAVFFAAQALIVVGAQTTLLSRQLLFLEGEVERSWAPMPAPRVERGFSVTRWRAGEAYEAGSIVVHKGRYFVARVSTPLAARGMEPSDVTPSAIETFVHGLFAAEDDVVGTSRVLLVLQVAQVRRVLCGLMVEGLFGEEVGCCCADCRHRPVVLLDDVLPPGEVARAETAPS